MTSSLKRALALLLTAGTCQAAEVGDTYSDAGKATFERHCAPCHGDSGQGAEPWYPAMQRLAQLRTPQELVETVLSGKFQRAGDVRGHTIPIMPGWSRLANEDIAAIINYIGAEWGDGPAGVTTEDVAAYRVAAAPAGRSNLDLSRAREIYFDRCVGCHSTNREGASGSALLPWSMRAAGENTTRTMIHYGSPKGMPGFGVEEALSADEMQALAEFLSQDIADPPAFGPREIERSRQDFKRPRKRPASGASPADLFVSLRHDVGGVLFIDGRKKRVVGTVESDVAPHAVTVSQDGQFLYVLSRGGRIAQIDLYAWPPRKTAAVRVGFEARSLAATRIGDQAVIAAATFQPGHIAFLDARTLELVALVDPRPPGTTTGQFRLSDVIAVPGDAAVVAAAKDQGMIHHIDTSSAAKLTLTSLPTERFLRSGSMHPAGRLLLIPTDDERLVVFDVAEKRVRDTIHVPGMSGASRGVFFEDPKHGQVWVASAMASDSLTFVGADPSSPEQAWRIVRSIQTEGAGSLYVANHPNSRHLWFDAPLNSSRYISGSLFTVDKSRPDAGYGLVNVVEALDPVYRGGRALHPQLSKDGTELWLTVWNRQDETSAIVVLNEATGEVKKVIKDSRLITPIRTYALWQFATTPSSG